VKDVLNKLIGEALRTVGIKEVDFVVEHPTNLKMGDYSTNAGIKYRDKKDEIVNFLNKNKPEEVERIEVVGPGFINFYLSKKFFAESLKRINKEGKNFGKTKKWKGEKVMIEYTDANPFKEFHIGHLMSNSIGEALSRIVEWNGAKIVRANYQGDVGMHVAKAVWAMLRGEDSDAYTAGARAYEDNVEARKEIEEINKMIYDRSNKQVNKVYDEGRKKSLEAFEEMYKKLGTRFDYYFFESEVGKLGKKIVEENIGKVFEKTDGPVVFHGEKYDSSLHTRVFINSLGLPTYEAKDIGNAINKYKKYKYTKSIVVTGNEIKEYFKVMLQALKLIYPEISKKTTHLPHGMLRLPSGKMSSRTGDVITAKSLIEEVKKRVKDDEAVALGAIKYTILRQSIGNDIIFDIDKSISTEGDSGVYLQYAHARATTLLEKAGRNGNTKGERVETHEIERLLYRFPEIVERSLIDSAPHHLTTYLTHIAGSFNNFYAKEQVLNDSPESTYRLAIVEAFRNVMRSGLWMLGIKAVDKM